MWTLIGSLTLVFLFLPVSFVLLLEPITLFFQQKCQELTPRLVSSEPIWQALVCGVDIYDSFWTTALKSSGLLHIFIVSGSHFLVIISLLRSIRSPKAVTLILIILYNFCTGFSAPGTRACLTAVFSDSLKVSPQQKILCISLACLCLHPPWIRSFSFWLSWMASLLLILSPRDPLRIIQNLIFFLSWQLMGAHIHLWSLALNILIAPLIGWALFPLALLSHLPNFHLLFDGAIQMLEWMLRELSLHKVKIPFGLSLGGLSFVTLFSHFYLQVLGLERQGRKLR